MKVFRVIAEVEVEFLVAAETEDEARFAAEESAEDAMEEQRWCNPPYVSVTQEITDTAQVPKGWLNSLPYGDGAEDRTVAEILTSPESEPAEVKDEWTLPMFKGGGDAGP